MDCSSTYIGETRRSLKKEISGTVRRGDMNNRIAVHAWEHQHRVDWENSIPENVTVSSPFTISV